MVAATRTNRPAVSLPERLDDWKGKYGGLEVSQLRRLKQMEDENKRLKQIVADLTLDKQMLREVVTKKLYGRRSGANWCSSRGSASR